MITMIIILFMLGAMGGSFACAQVWRLRARQLHEDKAAGEQIDSKELSRLQRLIRPMLRDRSECLHCHHILRWYDLVPVISWVVLRGRCRYCRHSIGYTEILSELGVGAVFLLSYLYWPFEQLGAYAWVLLALWLIACVLMAILFIYDAKWYLLPFWINAGLICVGVVYATYVFISGTGQTAVSLISGIGILGGLYYVFSRFGWVGEGDAILGVGLALFAGSWQHSLLVLFLANLLGCFMLIPLALRGALKRSMHIPFGPFLIVGLFVSVLWGDEIIQTIMNIVDPFGYMVML